MALESVKQVAVPTLKVGQALIDPSALTAPRVATMPDKSGTVAMISDIPGASGGVVDYSADYAITYLYPGYAKR